jgi:hypothetical protein
MHHESELGRVSAAPNTQHSGKATTAGVRTTHARAIVAAAMLGAVMSFGRAARADCESDSPCPATPGESWSTPVPQRSAPATSTASPSLLVGGLVLTSVGALAIVVAGGAALAGGMDCAMSSGGHQDSDEACPVSPVVPLAGLSGIVFLAVGIPLIVVGAKTRPNAQVSKPAASLGPWLGPRTAGLGFRLEM